MITDAQPDKHTDRLSDKQKDRNHLVWTTTHLLVRPEVDSSERTREDYHLLDMLKICILLLIVLTESLEQEITTPLERTCSYSKFDSCVRRLPTKDKYVEVTSKFPVNFLCDTKTDGGGWIVFQRRFYRDTDFNRSFIEYEKGFGTICSDFWLGNSLLYTLTSQDKYELRVDMVFEGQRFYAQYDNFKVSSKKTHYTLTLGNFRGNVIDSLAYHNNSIFATADRHPYYAAVKCAHYYETGWWFKMCTKANLNGRFDSDELGVNWLELTGVNKSLTSVEMKMRRSLLDE
ncbi:hypothetical protein Btru_046364 [Bulinus truncatus]|nr:hypothetical protein Btru_046364 [Bulinus truncatus]